MPLISRHYPTLTVVAMCATTSPIIFLLAPSRRRACQDLRGHPARQTISSFVDALELSQFEHPVVIVLVPSRTEHIFFVAVEATLPRRSQLCLAADARWRSTPMRDAACSTTSLRPTSSRVQHRLDPCIANEGFAARSGPRRTPRSPRARRRSCMLDGGTLHHCSIYFEIEPNLFWDRRRPVVVLFSDQPGHRDQRFPSPHSNSRGSSPSAFSLSWARPRQDRNQQVLCVMGKPTTRYLLSPCRTKSVHASR